MALIADDRAYRNMSQISVNVQVYYMFRNPHHDCDRGVDWTYGVVVARYAPTLSPRRFMLPIRPAFPEDQIGSPTRNGSHVIIYLRAILELSLYYGIQNRLREYLHRRPFRDRGSKRNNGVVTYQKLIRN